MAPLPTPQALVEQGQRAWPHIRVDATEASAYFAQRLEHAKERLNAPDLFLAFACVRQDPVALAAFDEQVLPAALAPLEGRDFFQPFADETAQRIREELLLAPEGRPPRLSGYGGQGSLRNWLRAVAIRFALQLRRSAKPTEDVGDLELASEDPELGFIRERYRGDFRAAFEQALAALTAEDRNVLRFHLVEGLSIDQLGALYRVHRATAARWLARSREFLLDETRRRLAERLKLSRDELDSLMRLFGTNLDVSLISFLTRATP